MTSPPRPKLPSVHVLRDRVRAIRRLDLREAEIHFLKKRLELLCVGYSLRSPVLMPGQLIFRGRIISDKPRHLSDLTYPPKEFVKSLGRVNRSGNPFFYGSVDRAATFFEVNAKTGDHIAVSRWSLHKRIIVNSVGFTKHVLDSYGATRQLPFWTNEDPSLPPDLATIIANPSAKLVHDFFAHEFTREVRNDNTHEYKLSIAISEILIGHSLMFDNIEEVSHHPPYFGGIVYPSLAMLANSDNIALKPEFVDKYLKFESVEFVKVDEFIEPSAYKVTTIDYANSTSEDGAIEWKGRLPTWNLPPGATMKLTVENGMWVARDMSGKIMEPN